MVKVDFSKPLVLVLARNPWLSGQLAKAAREVGVNIKKMFYFRNPPPWAKEREYLKGASEAQLKVWETFGSISASTYGKPIDERIKIIREQMSGKRFTSRPYRTLPSGRRVPERPRRNMYKIIAEKLSGGRVEQV